MKEISTVQQSSPSFPEFSTGGSSLRMTATILVALSFGCDRSADDSQSHMNTIEPATKVEQKEENIDNSLTMTGFDPWEHDGEVLHGRLIKNGQSWPFQEGLIGNSHSVDKHAVDIVVDENTTVIDIAAEFSKDEIERLNAIFAETARALGFLGHSGVTVDIMIRKSVEWEGALRMYALPSMASFASSMTSRVPTHAVYITKGQARAFLEDVGDSDLQILHDQFNAHMLAGLIHIKLDPEIKDRIKRLENRLEGKDDQQTKEDTKLEQLFLTGSSSTNEKSNNQANNQSKSISPSISKTEEAENSSQATLPGRQNNTKSVELTLQSNKPTDEWYLGMAVVYGLHGTERMVDGLALGIDPWRDFQVAEELKFEYLDILYKQVICDEESGSFK